MEHFFRPVFRIQMNDKMNRKKSSSRIADLARKFLLRIETLDGKLLLRIETFILMNT
jgi:hypothetical protein